MKEKLSELTQYVWLYDYWTEKVKELKRSEDTFDVMDLDDTIFSVQERIDSDEIFQKNRWEQWNILITNELGLKKVTNTYYKNKSFPKDILEKVNNERSLILTAWLREYQEEKVELMWIQDYYMLVTPTAQEKIIALIRYVIFDLKWIPSLITVYEDRPQYFIEYKGLLEDILQTKIIIKKVEMNWNNGYKKIEEIK